MLGLLNEDENGHKTMSEELKKMFHTEMLRIYEHAKIRCDYNANRFRQMVLEHKGHQAAKMLLRSNILQDGLVKLWGCKCLDLTMEALILKKPWCDLFTEEELNIARTRLQELGYK